MRACGRREKTLRERGNTILYKCGAPKKTIKAQAAAALKEIVKPDLRRPEDAGTGSRAGSHIHAFARFY